VNNVLTKSFLADPLYSNEIQNDFYDTRAQLQRTATDKNLNEKLNSKLVTPEEKLRGKFDKSGSEMSKIRKEISKLQASNDPNKEQKIRDLQAKILGLAQSTLDKNKLGAFK
jgi:predicted nuclease with TOPRIM domain